MSANFFFSLIIFAILPINKAFSQDDLSAVSSGMFRISAEVDVVSHDKERVGFNLAFDNKSGGFFGCSNTKTILKWPGLEEKINELTMYNFTIFPNASKEIGSFTQEDFYCDTFTGKLRNEMYWVADRLNKNIGKKIKIQVEGVLTVAAVKNSKKRLETISLTSVEFYSGDRMISKFAHSEKGPQGYALLTWLGR